MLYPPYILTSRGKGGRRVMLKVTFGTCLGSMSPVWKRRKACVPLLARASAFCPVNGVTLYHD